MEVHHSHSKPPGEKKKVKEYFFDFFMLFLAVTAGFYAENLREKYVDRTKEHDYMESFVADLQQDSAHLAIAIADLKTFKSGLDSLARICYTKNKTDSVLRVMYDLNSRYLRLIPLTFSDRTSSQLKNSGSLRLIRNKQVSDSILNYWEEIDYFHYVSPLNENFRLKARELSFKIYDYGEYNQGDNIFAHNNLRRQNPQLISNDTALMHEYINFLWAYKTTLGIYYYPPVMKLQTQAKNLIALIKEKYEME